LTGYKDTAMKDNLWSEQAKQMGRTPRAKDLVRKYAYEAGETQENEIWET